MHMTILPVSFYSEPAHLVLLFRSTIMLAIKSQIDINQSVYKKAIPKNPLLIPPVTCRQLVHYNTVRRALIFHPQHGLFYRLLQEIILT